VGSLLHPEGLREHVGDGRPARCAIATSRRTSSSCPRWSRVPARASV